MSGILADNTGRASGLVKSGTSAETIKAWINFNGTGTAAIRASSNVSSLSDHSTGNFSIAFTTDMSDVNYGVAFMDWYGSDSGGGNNHITEGSRISGTMAVGSVRVLTCGGTNAQDHEVTTLVVYR